MKVAEHPLGQHLRLHVQIQNQVRHDGESEDPLYPLRVYAPHHVPRDGRVDVPVRQHDEVRLQRRNDHVLDLVRQVGRVVERERKRPKRVALHDVLELLAHQPRPFESGLRRCVPLPLQPVAKEPDLSRPPRAVRTFDHHQPAPQRREVDVGNSRPEVCPLRGSGPGRHGDAPPGALGRTYWERSSRSRMRLRNSCCCSPAGFVASMTWKGNSCDIRSYVSCIFVWKIR